MHKDVPIRISITNPSSVDSRDDGHVILELEDAISGETLGRIDMPTGRFHRLQLGSTMTFSGEYSSHFERVGKLMKVEQLTVPQEVTGWGKNRQQDAVQWLTENKPAYWETAELRSTNQGWVAIGRWWVEPTDDERREWLENRYL